MAVIPQRLQLVKIIHITLTVHRVLVYCKLDLVFDKSSFVTRCFSTSSRNLSSVHLIRDNPYLAIYSQIITVKANLLSTRNNKYGSKYAKKNKYKVISDRYIHTISGLDT